MKKVTTGFSLIELLIVIAIIAILATAAFPQYKNYTNKAQVIADLSGIDAYKLGVAVCYNLLGTFEGCSEGQVDIPAKGGNVTSVINGVIQVEVTYAGNTKIVQYAGKEEGGTLTWVISSNIEGCENIVDSCSPLEVVE